MGSFAALRTSWVKQDEEAGPMLPIARLEAPGVGGVGVVGEEGSKHEPIDGVLDRRRRSVNEAGVSVSRMVRRWMARPNRWRSSTAQTSPV